MNKLLIVIVSVFVLFFNCGKKSKKIELYNEENSSINREIMPENSANKSNEKLSPETFFKISIEINKLTKEYNKKLENLPETQINTLLKKLDSDIQNIYLKFNTSESEFNNYSLHNYKELDEYLRNHPEIDKEMRQ